MICHIMNLTAKALHFEILLENIAQFTTALKLVTDDRSLQTVVFTNTTFTPTPTDTTTYFKF